MTTILVKEGYQLNLPTELQAIAPVGTQFRVTVDPTGRIILTPEAQVRAILMETFGMWLDHQDVPADGVDYVNDIRSGRRLDQLERMIDETD